MYCNRDELMLFSRTGRFPPAARAGPGHRHRMAADEQDRFARRGRGGRLRRVLAHLRPSAPTGGRAPEPLPSMRGWPSAPTGGRPPEPLPSMRGYADRQAYLELEFAVGFAVEEEKL